MRRDGVPVALIDWDLAGPGERLVDVASAAYHWAPLRTDGPEELSRRRPRAGARGRSATATASLRRNAASSSTARSRCASTATSSTTGSAAVERQPGWRDMWDRGSGERIRANAAWLVEHRDAIERALA